MRRMPKQPWEQWRNITRDIYLQHFKGWPEAEMRRYWESNLSPLSANDAAARRRARETIDTDKCRETCTVCWADPGRPWPCAKEKVSKRGTTATQEPTA